MGSAFVMIHKISFRLLVKSLPLVQSYERSEMFQSDRPLETSVLNSVYYISGVYSGTQWKTSVNMGSL